MPVDINRLTEGWLELESDPGLFTLLLEDFGVKGVQVEEIYDLQKSLEGPVYGFIFLFRWIEERRSRRKVVDQSETFVKDEEVVNNIFFAQQMVPNSCATHALLSVLLNCPNIHLGATLSRLKAHTSGMCPENKGWAIGNTPELAKAHNSHAMPQAKRRLDKSSGVSTGRYTGEAFHFVSYVPIHGKLFELDGLKPFPMDHGPWGDKEDWTEKFRRVITDRLGIATGEQYHDIRFNLMAVVPDRRLALVHKLKMLKTNRQIVLEALQQLVKLTHPEITVKENSRNGEEKKDTDAGGKKEAKTHNYAKIQLEPVSITNGAQGAKIGASEERFSGENEKSQSVVPTDFPAQPSVPKQPASSPVSKSQAHEASPSTTGIGGLQSSSPSDSVPSHLASTPQTLQSSSAETGTVSSAAKSVSFPLPSGTVSGTTMSAPVCTSQTVPTIVTASTTQPHSQTVSHTGTTTVQAAPAVSNALSATHSTNSTGALLSPPGPPDYSTPLTIQTSPAPSTSSTDTSSEVGSAFNSPTQGWGWNSGQSSPTSTKDFKKFVVIRVAGSGEEKVDSPSARVSSGKRISNESGNATKRVCLENGQRTWEKEIDKSVGSSREMPVALTPTKGNTAELETSTEEKKVDKLVSKYPELIEPHAFAPKDLLALLKNLENEISVCELNLRDENEKRKKYKIDDCRRTHNYDEFICTFLSMLTQQGKLADLVQQHLLLKKPGLPVQRVQRTARKTETRASPSRRRRGRTKYRKRK